MAVYDRRYRGYDGPLTPPATRWRVLPRYAWGGVFRSRLFVGFYALCFVWPIVGLLWIYVHHNLGVLSQVGVDAGDIAPPVDGLTAAGFLGIQCFAFGSIVALLIGPGLVAPDLANGGLPLYLSRPLTRTGYVLGKFATLATLLSLITWIPGVVLFLLEAWLSGFAWLLANLWLLAAIVAGPMIWIVTISLLTLAMSALARRKIIAQTFLLGLVIFGGVAGETINVLFGTRLGFVFNIPELMHSVWEGLFRVDLNALLPSPVAWLGVAGLIALSVAILARKLRAYEVVS